LAILALFFALALPRHLGYPAVAGLVALESMGIPVPGETALIAGAVLAHQGQLDIVILIAVVAAAAIVGDNVGYLIGRRGGRALLERSGPFERHRRAVLRKGEPFFERHGPKAVFLGRWVAGLRIAAAWLAGINRMRWTTFLVWNAAGGIAWAVSVGLVGYFVGAAAEKLIRDVGFVAVALVVVAALVVAALVVIRRRRAQSLA